MTSSLVGSEMCIRDRLHGTRKGDVGKADGTKQDGGACAHAQEGEGYSGCLLYTSDAADDM
eukprot:109239-Prorocentrum_lima.AAC.1